MSERKIIRVRDVMKHEYDLVDGRSSVRQVLNMMQHVETKCIIVNKRHADDEYGIVVLADIARNVLDKNKSPDRVSIYEVMTKPTVVINPNMNIRYASSLFSRLGLSGAPVVEEKGDIIGVVSHTDIVLKGLMKLY